MSSAAGAAGAGGGVGFLLDSAVRTAVGHLASSQPLQERRQHLDQYDYYGDAGIEYADYTDYSHYAEYEPGPGPGWRHHHRVAAPQRYSPPQPSRRQDGAGAGLLGGVARLLPLALALPVMAAASYYLVVLNGPTPVVKERSDSASDPATELGARILELVASLVTGL